MRTPTGLANIDSLSPFTNLSLSPFTRLPIDLYTQSSSRDPHSRTQTLGPVELAQREYNPVLFPREMRY